MNKGEKSSVCLLIKHLLPTLNISLLLCKQASLVLATTDNEEQGPEGGRGEREKTKETISVI